jgi:hypothetical protein
VKRLLIEQADESINLQDFELLTKFPFFADYNSMCLLSKNEKPSAIDFQPLPSPKSRSCFKIATSEEKLIVNNSESSTDKQQRLEQEPWTVSDVLNNDETRRIFKLHAAREFSTENVLFWEANYLKFKKIRAEERKAELQIITNTFLSSDSVLEINTTKQYIDKVLQEMSADVVSDTILDPISKDLEATVLSDSYTRFRLCTEFKILKKNGKIH